MAQKNSNRTPNRGEKSLIALDFKNRDKGTETQQECDFANWNFPIALLAHGNLSQLWVASKEYTFISKRLLGSAGPTADFC